MRSRLLLALTAIGVLGASCADEQPTRSFDCADPARVTRLENVHYENVSCEAAIQSAEARRGAAYFRKACQQLAPGKGLPGPATDADVASCEETEPDSAWGPGALLHIDVCCP